MQSIQRRARIAYGCVLSTVLILGSVIAGSVTVASGQQAVEGKWADENDPVAKQLIEQERKWAVLYCTPSNVIAEFVADDFVGTAPDGPTYTKSGLMQRHTAPTPEHDCKLLSARVRFYGPELAIIYGSETAVRTGPDGKDFQRTLIWTDTVLKRNGKWQLIAVQDMFDPKK
jgi:hypothetical protein